MSLRAGISADEPTLWQARADIAQASLDFGIAFLGCRMGSDIDQLLDDASKGRLSKIVRACSWVESKHGTAGANQPVRDPIQCGNPGDLWWRELTGQSGPTPIGAPAPLRYCYVAASPAVAC
jgi:hypothetical protein